MDFLNTKIIPLEVETKVLDCEKVKNGFMIVLEFSKFFISKKAKLTQIINYPFQPVNTEEKPKVNDIKFINSFVDLDCFSAETEVFSTVKKDNEYKLGRKVFTDTIIEKVSQGKKFKNYKDKQFQLVYIYDGDTWVPFPLIYNGICKELSQKEKGIFDITENLSSQGWMDRCKETAFLFPEQFSRF